MTKREYIEKKLKDIESQIAKEKTVAIYKAIEDRKQEFVRHMEEHYICIDDGQGGRIAMKKK